MEVRNVIRQLQYDIKVHLTDEVPIEFEDMNIRPDPRYGAPPVTKNTNHNFSPPSPTYGVPGHKPGIPQNYPHEFEQRSVFLSTPSPTYGVPNNAYIPPATVNNNFQVHSSGNSPNYFPTTPNHVPKGSNGAGGYVYNKPNANLKSSPALAQFQTKGKDEPNDSSASKSEEDEGSIRSIELTTKSAPRSAPDFFFSEQFETTPIPPTIATTTPPQRQQQQQVFQPPPQDQQQRFLPNSSPAPFSTAVYQEKTLKLPEEAEPLPTLATIVEPPSPQAKNFYRTDPQPAASQTVYNQAEWFRRISRSLANESEILVHEETTTAMTVRESEFIEELRNNRLLLDTLFPVEPAEEEVEEDLIINFEAAHLLRGNRTKRQLPGSNRMCETTTQYIEPQAALSKDGELSVVSYDDADNNKNFYYPGEWRFIVNQVENTKQLVRVELCA